MDQRRHSHDFAVRP